jgi:DNA adenine methylase
MPACTNQNPPVFSASRSRQAARPFIKWAGGKRQILRELVQRVPKFKTYHEPFLGGGALFFALRPAKAVLADNNLRLVRAWRGVRDDVETVIALLQTYPHDREFFLELRERPIDQATDPEVAAWFIYLNKTGYNGLYRVNSRNVFNVPFGRYSNPTICDATNLRACAKALQGIEILHDDFGSVLGRARRGDFVYFDPPYVPLSTTSVFTSYTAEGFGREDQRRLRDVALKLKAKGVHVLLSNSSSALVRDLYADRFVVEEVSANRNLNCKGEKRGPVTEVIIR